MSKVYPNPNSGQMLIEYFIESHEQGLLEIFDLTGKVINSYNLSAENNELSINENLENGIYFYRILLNGNTLFMDKITIIK